MVQHILVACESQHVLRLQCMLSLGARVKHVTFIQGQADNSSTACTSVTLCRCLSSSIGAMVLALTCLLSLSRMCCRQRRQPQELEEGREHSVKLDRHTGHLTCI